MPGKNIIISKRGSWFLVSSGNQDLAMPDLGIVRCITTPPSPNMQGTWAEGAAMIMFQGGAIVVDGVTVEQMRKAMVWAKEVGDANVRMELDEPPDASNGLVIA